MKFGVSTERPTDKDFFLNSNFFGEQDPIGLVVVDKKDVQAASGAAGTSM